MYGQRNFLLLRQPTGQFQPISKPQTQYHQTEEEQMDDVLETIRIALNGGSHGCHQHNHRIDDNVVPNNGPYQGHPPFSGRG